MELAKKIFNLINEGFSNATLEKFSETQINKLHKKLVETKPGYVEEQVKQTTKQVKTTTIPSATAKTTGAVIDGMSIKQDGAGNIVATQAEAEMAEASKKTSKYNPWAICTSSLSDEFGTSERSEWSKPQMAKYERCVKDVKKGIKEGVNPMEIVLENKFLHYIEKHTRPALTKQEILNIVKEGSYTKNETAEQSPVIAPPKPKTPKTIPSTPYKPKPGVKPAPKAKKTEANEQSPVIAPPKPKTPKTIPSTPYKPKPGVKPAPKAKTKENLPSWLAFDKIGVNLK